MRFYHYNCQVMSFVKFIITFSIGTLFSWVAWLMVLFTLDPFSGGWLVLGLFYVSLFLALIGTLSLINFFLRYWWEKEKIVFRQFSIAVRQSLLITSGVIVALMLQSIRLLNIWSLGALALLLIVTEMFFLAGQVGRMRTD